MKKYQNQLPKKLLRKAAINQKMVETVEKISNVRYNINEIKKGGKN